LPEITAQASLLALIGPASLSVFAVAFLCLWLLDLKRRYLLIFVAATVSYCSGWFCEILGWASDPGINAMLSGMLYACSALCLAEGVMRRSKMTLGVALHLAVLITVFGGLYYFYYVSENLVARIYVHGISYGVLFLYLSTRLTVLRAGKPIDRVLYWVIVAFSLQFFVRMIFIGGVNLPGTLQELATAPFWIATQITLAVFCCAVDITLMAAAVIDRIDDLQQDRDTDSLTGLLNRRGFEERAAAMIANARSFPTCVILADVDNFKLINDNFGHQTGDRVLQQVSSIFTGRPRGGDLTGRIGGEEFAIIVLNCDIHGGAALAERIRSRLALEAITELGIGAVTASLGVAEIEAGETLWDAIDRADKMLYAAKHGGRNRVAFWQNGKPGFTSKLSVVV
jgi:diguanylate cyclase (GGDEF)-like protein